MTRARENADIHDGSTAITTVGTVTAGNLSNASIVYPSGHVIKYWAVVRTTDGTGRSQTVETPYATVNLGGLLQIGGITATEGNKFRATFGGWAHNTHADNTYSSLYRIHDGANRLAGYEFYYDTNDQSAQMNAPISLTSVFQVPANFTNKTVYVQVARQASHPAGTYLQARCLTGSPNSSSSCNTFPFFELIEIKA